VATVVGLTRRVSEGVVGETALLTTVLLRLRTLLIVVREFGRCPKAGSGVLTGVLAAQSRRDGSFRSVALNTYLYPLVAPTDRSEHLECGFSLRCRSGDRFTCFGIRLGLRVAAVVLVFGFCPLIIVGEHRRGTGVVAERLRLRILQAGASRLLRQLVELEQLGNSHITALPALNQ
jgi:hypothetical protein